MTALKVILGVTLFLAWAHILKVDSELNGFPYFESNKLASMTNLVICWKKLLENVIDFKYFTVVIVSYSFKRYQSNVTM